MDNTTRFQRNPDYIFRNIVGEAVLVPTGKACQDFNGMATMNGTGVFLWELLEKERTLSELSQCLAEKYDLDVKQCMEDAAEFLKEAQEKHVVIQC
ncbi:MAG: PqqD family protein [Clostridiales bacterium]|nr:PqqD family protein [Clostridiales bacterium]